MILEEGVELSMTLEYKEIRVVVPKEFDIEGLASYLAMNEEEFLKELIRTGVEAELCIEEEPENLVDRYGLKRVIDWW